MQTRNGEETEQKYGEHFLCRLLHAVLLKTFCLHAEKLIWGVKPSSGMQTCNGGKTRLDLEWWYKQNFLHRLLLVDYPSKLHCGDAAGA